MQRPICAHSGAPVNQFRQGFFSKPKILQKQAPDPGQKKPKTNNRSDGNASGDSEAVFRNVIHELQDRDLPVEMHYARTDDGYWIPVVRVPAKSKLQPSLRRSLCMCWHVPRLGLLLRI